MQIKETLLAGAKIKRPVTGRYLVVYAADGEIEVSGQGIEAVRLRQGATLDMGVSAFNKEITVRNLGASSNAIDLEASALKIGLADNKDFTVNTTATVENGNDNAHLPRITIAAGASGVLATANASREYLRVSLPSDAAGHITLGKSGVTAAAGGLLEPGSTDYMETEGVLYAFNDNADPVDVYVMEINRL